MDNLETNTKILEQCRLDMDNLAGLGAAGMDEAVTKAEKRARICGQELRQASKAVELTAKQKKTVEDARLAGEEKLSAAVQDEEDARIAAETVRRMIEDAASVRGSSNKDTAKILEKAETVLDDTLSRADHFYSEKKAQREEIEHAMLRLYATEKAVLYTMAKAERNEGEKQLNKIIADKKHEVCAAEYQVLLLHAKEAELQDEADSHQESLQGLEAEIVLANAQVEESLKIQKKAGEDFSLQLRACAEEIAAALQQLSLEQARCQEQHGIAESELRAAKGMLEDCQAEEVDRRESLGQMQLQSRESIADAHKEYEQGLADQNRQLVVYQEAVKHSRLSLDDALAKQEAAVAEAARLQELAEEFSLKAAEAEAEEVSAREAAATANRLAENAIKIRESISSESSQLLFHAQEVLMEAAASAQQLMDEKSLMRTAAQNESDRISKQAALAENTVRQAEELVEIKKADCRESDMQLENAQIVAAAKKEELQARMERKIAEAEELLHSAESAADQAASNVVEAIEQRDHAQLNLETIIVELENITRHLEEARIAGAERQKTLQLHVDQENARLKKEHEKALANAQDLEENRKNEEQILEELNQNINELLAQIDLSSIHVQEVIAKGAESIRNAELEVDHLSELEQEAHAVAEEAVSKMSIDSQQLGLLESSSLSSLAGLIVEKEEPRNVESPALPPFSQDAFQPEPAPEKAGEIYTENSFSAPSMDFLGGESWMDQAALFFGQEKESPHAAPLAGVEAFPLPEEIAAPPLPPVELAPKEELSATELPQEVFVQPENSFQLFAEVETLAPEQPLIPEEAPAHPEQPLIPEEAPALPEQPLIPEEAPAPPEQPLIPEEAPALPEQPLIPEEAPALPEQPLIPEEKPVFSFVDSLMASENEVDMSFLMQSPAKTPASIAAPQSPAAPEEEQKAPEAVLPKEDASPVLEEAALIGQKEISPVTEAEAAEEVDEVALAVMKEVNEAAARMAPMADGDQPYDGKALDGNISPMLEKDMERTGSWQRQEMSEEELEYTMHLEDVSARLLEQTIIPTEEENEPSHLYQPSDWLANLTKSLGEEPSGTTAGEPAAAASPKGEIDLEQLLNKKPQEEGAASVPDGQIKVPELELPPINNASPRWKSQEETRSTNQRKRRFRFF